MDTEFTEIAPAAIRDNPFHAIGKDWMLITAGPLSAYNTMTASWGAWGHLWEFPVAICFVRPQRYTFGFMENAGHFTLSYFSPQYRAALDYCGTHSGRDGDKAAAADLTPVATPSGAVTFQQARLVLECRKVYAGDILGERFVDPAVREEMYAKGDFHRMFIGEIARAWVK